MKSRANTLLQTLAVLQPSCRRITQADRDPPVAYTQGEMFLLGGIQGLLMHWQSPAALVVIGICCKLVKALCMQTALIYPRVLARHSNNHRSRECETSLMPPFQSKSSDVFCAF